MVEQVKRQWQGRVRVKMVLLGPRPSLSMAFEPLSGKEAKAFPQKTHAAFELRGAACKASPSLKNKSQLSMGAQTRMPLSDGGSQVELPAMCPEAMGAGQKKISARHRGAWPQKIASLQKDV